jgi:hypothetical protein
MYVCAFRAYTDCYAENSERADLLATRAWCDLSVEGQPLTSTLGRGPGHFGVLSTPQLATTMKQHMTGDPQGSAPPIVSTHATCSIVVAAFDRQRWMSADDDQVCVEVRDDRRGLPAAPLEGVGLPSMRHRGESFGGALEVRSGPDGTTVTRFATREADMTVTPVRVVLADDHPMFRYGVRTVLDDAPEIELVGEEASGRGCSRFPPPPARMSCSPT